VSARRATPGTYLDTSCLLKLLWQEPESARVAVLIERESRVVVSELTILEAVVQIHGRRVAGLLRGPDAKRLESALDRLLDAEPFERIALDRDSFDRARAQVRRLRKRGYCRTLDRLHLAVMEVERLRRLLTNDDKQAVAARAAGMKVTLPRAGKLRSATVRRKGVRPEFGNRRGRGACGYLRRARRMTSRQTGSPGRAERAARVRVLRSPNTLGYARFALSDRTTLRAFLRTSSDRRSITSRRRRSG
jgi:predicted nucleic acid-binding protein